MLRSIQFNYNIRLRTKEINNKSIDYFLSIDRYGKFTQKIMPQMSFFFGHILS